MIGPSGSVGADCPAGDLVGCRGDDATPEAGATTAFEPFATVGGGDAPSQAAIATIAARDGMEVAALFMGFLFVGGTLCQHAIRGAGAWSSHGGLALVALA